MTLTRTSSLEIFSREDGLDLAEEIFQRDLLGRADGVGLLAALLGELAGHALVLDGVEGVARAGDLGHAGDLHRGGGAGLGDAAALVVDHRADTADGAAGNDDVAGLQGAVLDQDGHDRAAALVKARLDDGTAGGTVRVGLELLHLGQDDQVFQEVVDAHTGLGRNRADNRVAAPFLAHEVILGELLLDAVGVRAHGVHLVDRHDDGDVRRLGVVDALSTVWGMMPSSAATTRMAISVTMAPRARMEVKASWPGVSRKVMGLPLISTV